MYDTDMMETKTLEFDIKDNTFIDTYNYNYEEKDIDNIEVEFKVNKTCDVRYSSANEKDIHVWAYLDNYMDTIRDFVSNFNDYKIIVNSDCEIYDVTVYASKKNIEKLKENYENRIIENE
jgi:hypothetical protein